MDRKVLMPACILSSASSSLDYCYNQCAHATCSTSSCRTWSNLRAKANPCCKMRHSLFAATSLARPGLETAAAAAADSISSSHSVPTQLASDMASAVPAITLNNGKKMPIFGLGTWKVNLRLFVLRASVPLPQLHNSCTISVYTFALFRLSLRITAVLLSLATLFS